MAAFPGPADWWTDYTDAGRTHIAKKGIVQTNLVLNLDFGSSECYVGSGTTINDLSTTGATATILGTGTSFTDNAFVFGGTGYAEITARETALEFQPTVARTLCVWMKGATSGTGAIFANMDNSSPYTGWDLYKNGTDLISIHIISAWSGEAIKVQWTYTYANYSTTWSYLCFTYDGSSPTTAQASLDSVNFYLNGQLTTAGKSNSGTDGWSTGSATTTYNTSQRFRLNSRWASGSIATAGAGNASLGSIQIYNKALTAAEVQQNYNALRGRYGI